MSTKVLVFESDATFASELQTELGKLGCDTFVVDDGNIGLQQAATDRPDLILLSIELPRMNGFSVCNKLKKDPALRDVPLIIMSSESSDETFEQHRKLRTRAEDYIHKPIAFGELLEHIQSFIPMGAGQLHSSGGIVIEDDLEGIEIDEEATAVYTAEHFAKSKASAEDDLDAITDAAFGRLTDGGPTSTQNGSRTEGRSVPPPPPPPASVRASAIPPSRKSIPPRPAGSDSPEFERVKGEVERWKTRTAELEKELSATRIESTRLQDDLLRGERSDAEAQRMQREIDELRAKLAGAAKTGGVSSREFLDLREALNKKDKEILSLKETFAKKDKDIFEARDKSLQLERAHSDIEEKLLSMERELGDAREKVDALAADKDQAKKASEDFKVRLSRVQGELEARVQEMSELRAHQAEETRGHESFVSNLKAEHYQTLEHAKEEKARALEQAEAARVHELEQARNERDAAVEEARQRASHELEEAVSRREGELRAELRAETDTKLAALHRAHSDELQRAKADFSQQLDATLSKHISELAAAEARREEQLDATREEASTRLAAREQELEEKRSGEIAGIEAERDQRLSDRAREHQEQIARLENERDARIASVEARAAREIEDANVASAAQKAAFDEKLTALDLELAETRSQLSELSEAKRAADAASEGRILDLEQRLGQTILARDEHERNLFSARDRITAFEAEVAALRADLREHRDKLTTETQRASTAFAKWEADRASLDRAKDALAVALSQIEEAEGRPIQT